ncbi:MAG: tetratricopeptide repeat protein, partial [Micrococcales bacterium]|nr:tetratricopeptide repeat protein [Micrococcales bacterium]
MAEIINYYDALGLDRDATVPQINEALKNLRLQLSAKVSRPSSQQSKWQQQLDLLPEAELAFLNEDSRERYDVELRRAGGVAQDETEKVDWTNRAWTYYFTGDDGAGMVAARKAKEQSPNSPMPFVVSAWLNLRNDELKQAKQDADEAFVLDEATTDSVDVQMVRGTVYALLKDYERALQCFDRALPKASEGEKAEIYWRKGWAQLNMGDYQAAYDSTISGLSVDAELTSTMIDRLEVVACGAYNSLDNAGLSDSVGDKYRGRNPDTVKPQDAAKAADKYEARRKAVQSSGIFPTSMTRITKNLKSNCKRCQKLGELLDERNRQAAVPAAKGMQPDIPLSGIAAT